MRLLFTISLLIFPILAISQDKEECIEYRWIAIKKEPCNAAMFSGEEFATDLISLFCESEIKYQTAPDEFGFTRDSIDADGNFVYQPHEMEDLVEIQVLEKRVEVGDNHKYVVEGIDMIFKHPNYNSYYQLCATDMSEIRKTLKEQYLESEWYTFLVNKSYCGFQFKQQECGLEYRRK